MDRQKTHDWETHGKSNDINESTPVEKVKGPNVFERAKEEIEALIEAIHPHKNSDQEHRESKDVNEEDIKVVMDRQETHDRETDGKSNGINESTPVEKVKAPNVFERAKEEIEAVVEAIHPHKSSDQEVHELKIGSHHKETHGRSNDIDENTPVTEVKGPNVFERAKEEIEAIVEAIHHKKEPHE